MKEFALIFCALILIPFNAAADIIFFKDGMKTKPFARIEPGMREKKSDVNMVAQF